jgi:hypothetical protein
MQILIWFTTLFLLALWSAFAWGLHALLGLDPGWVGDLKPLIAQIPFGAFLDQWVPGWQALLSVGVDFTQTALRWAGAAAPWVVGLVWAVGAVLLLGVAALASVLLAVFRRKSAARG